MTAEEDAARKAAEARRQRILEKADNRIDSISGIRQEEDGDTPRVSAASKMAAARRRRFKKKDADKPKPEETATENAESAKKGAEEPVAETKAEPEKPTNDESIAAVKDTTTTKTTSEPISSSKKYLGVARMRRKKILEQRENSESNDNDNTTEVFAPSKKSKRMRRAPAKFPIVLHGLVVVLLFLAGLEVGLQQVEVDYTEFGGVQVHRDLSPRERGPGIARLLQKQQKAAAASIEKPLLKEDDGVVKEEQDEFAVPDTAATAGELDPLFGVDLDALTVGPGLYKAGTRFAVACHRLNLSIFYYGPQNLYHAILDFFTFTATPLLMIIALVLRHLVGKILLGAGLPGKDEEETKDIISVAIRFAKNFVAQAFPKAVTMYDAFNHLRSDMYVVLAGLVVGVTWSHHHGGGDPAAGSIVGGGGQHEEL